MTSESRFLALAQASADVFWLLTPGGEMPEVSSSWQTFTGQEGRAGLGRGWLDAVHPADHPSLEEFLLRATTSTQPTETECHIRWQNGMYRRLHVRVVPVREASAGVRELVVCGNDITRQKLAGYMSGAQAQLEEACGRIAEILESITDAFIHVDSNWRFTYVNARAKAYMGRDQEDLVGQFFWEVFSDLLETEMERQLREAMATRQSVQFEGWHPQWQRWLETRVCPTQGGLSMYFQDITRRKQAEESLRENGVRFRRLMESNIIGITIADADGTIHEANEAFLSLVGYTREDLMAGKVRWTAMTPVEYRKRYTQAIEEILGTGTFRPYEKEYIRKDGSRVPVMVGGALFRLLEGSTPQSVILTQDLTAHKEVERHKDFFLAVAGHELRTPLTALKGTVQLTERRVKQLVRKAEKRSPELCPLIDDLLKRLAVVDRQVDVQTHLISDLLDLSRITTRTLKLELGRCDLASLVRETVEDLRAAAPARSFLLALPESPTVVPVLADRERISQVIMNYGTNAIRYSPPDQPIQIGLSLQEGSVVRVWVRDRGPGIAPEVQQEVWQQFHQVKGTVAQAGSRKGLGLGLYLCQMLIAQHHGEVGVESRLGEGSTFWFTLSLDG